MALPAEHIVDDYTKMLVFGDDTNFLVAVRKGEGEGVQRRGEHQHCLRFAQIWEQLPSTHPGYDTVDGTLHLRLQTM